MAILAVTHGNWIPVGTPSVFPLPSAQQSQTILLSGLAAIAADIFASLVAIGGISGAMAVLGGLSTAVSDTAVLESTIDPTGELSSSLVDKKKGT